MAKTKISEFDANPANNTDIDGINLAEGMAPGLVNNAIRELMAQLKDFQAGSVGDDFSVGGNLAVTGTSAFTGNVTMSGTLTVGSNKADAFPSGTKMLFQQTTAPTGWTKDTTNNDKALRVVSGTAGTGGSIAFTTAFASQNVGDTTLTESQIPSHTHVWTGSTGGAGGHTHTGSTNTTGNHSHTVFGTAGGSSPTGILQPSAGTSNGAYGSSVNGSHSHTVTINSVSDHTHTVSGTNASTGGGGSHTHSLNIAVSYVDVIICTKS